MVQPVVLMQSFQFMYAPVTRSGLERVTERGGARGLRLAIVLSAMAEPASLASPVGCGVSFQAMTCASVVVPRVEPMSGP